MSKRFVDAAGHQVEQRKVLQLHIQPGAMNGARLQLPGETETEAEAETNAQFDGMGGAAGSGFATGEMHGSVRAGLSAAASDVVVTLSEQLHPRFSRQGDNLYYRHSLSLKEALLGAPFLVPTLDGRELLVRVTRRDVRQSAAASVFAHHAASVGAGAGAMGMSASDVHAVPTSSSHFSPPSSSSSSLRGAGGMSSYSFGGGARDGHASSGRSGRSGTPDDDRDGDDDDEEPAVITPYTRKVLRGEGMPRSIDGVRAAFEFVGVEHDEPQHQHQQPHQYTQQPQQLGAGFGAAGTGGRERSSASSASATDRGDLIITFDIRFPNKLSAEHRCALAMVDFPDF